MTVRGENIQELAQRWPRAVIRPDPSANLLMLMVDSCSSMLLVINSAGLIVRANPACAQMTGHPIDDVLGRPVWTMFQTMGGVQASQAFWDTALTASAEANSMEQVAFQAEGNRCRVRWSFVRTFDASGNCRYLIATGVDVTAERYAEATWRHRAQSDPLTGLANRSEFQTRLEEHHQSAGGHQGGVLIARLEDIGPAVGYSDGELTDRVLVEVANRLRRCVGQADVVSRFGDTEFALLLPEASELELRAMATRIQAAVGRPIRLSSGPLTVRIRTGHALLVPGQEALQAMLNADGAIYRVRPDHRPMPL